MDGTVYWSIMTGVLQVWKTQTYSSLKKSAEKKVPPHYGAKTHSRFDTFESREETHVSICRHHLHNIFIDTFPP